MWEGPRGEGVSIRCLPPTAGRLGTSLLVSGLSHRSQGLAWVWLLPRDLSTGPRTQPNLAVEAMLSSTQAPLGISKRGDPGWLWPAKT